MPYTRDMLFKAMGKTLTKTKHKIKEIVRKKSSKGGKNTKTRQK